MEAAFSFCLTFALFSLGATAIGGPARPAASASAYDSAASAYGSATSAYGPAASAYDQKCISSIQQCYKTFHRKASSLKDQKEYCTAAQESVACLNRFACPAGELSRRRAFTDLQYYIRLKSSGCNLGPFRMGNLPINRPYYKPPKAPEKKENTLPATTVGPAGPAPQSPAANKEGATATTVGPAGPAPQSPSKEKESATNNKSCSAGIQKCYISFMQKASPPKDQNEYCDAANECFKCLNGFSCNEPLRDNFLRNVRNSLRYKSPNCILGTIRSVVVPTPKPKKQEITVPDISNVQVKNLDAEYLEGTKVFLSWNIASNITPSAIEGFRIMLSIFNRRSKTEDSVEETTAVRDDKGRYSTTLILKRASKYEIKVKPYNKQSEGQASEPAYIYVSGKKHGITGHISVLAASLSTDAAVVSYEILGDKNESFVNFFYLKKNETVWTQVSKDSIAFRGENSVVLTGLQPGTIYYVFAKGWLQMHYRTSFTSMELPASDTTILNRGLDEELSLKKGKNEKGDDFVDWSDWKIQDVEGYKVTVTYNGKNGSSRRTEVKYLPKPETKLVFGSNTDTVDSVKVEPFDVYGLKGVAKVECVRCDSTSFTDPPLPPSKAERAPAHGPPIVERAEHSLK
ncbi:hypothetical protein RRG08_008968 [Elysia crispata]|uniref:Uncharacterized protein n=1 Tax=Elysia crispata TaxID=231223 RepID=A0AAE1DZE5_9GAST|nr:hypothetical protein RRG08_008968 [Elysia crispata]